MKSFFCVTEPRFTLFIRIFGIWTLMSFIYAIRLFLLFALIWQVVFSFLTREKHFVPSFSRFSVRKCSHNVYWFQTVRFFNEILYHTVLKEKTNTTTVYKRKAHNKMWPVQLQNIILKKKDKYQWYTGPKSGDLEEQLGAITKSLTI